MSIENQISMFNENGKIVHKIWDNNAWHDLNVASAASVSGFKEYGKGLHVFQVPAGVTQLTVSGTAAGAGGQAGFEMNTQRGGAGGGAGEWVNNHNLTVVPGETIAISVGSGGYGGLFTGVEGEDGGDTCIGYYLVLNGGRRSHSGGSNNGGPIVWNAPGQVGGVSTLVGDINTGCGGGSSVHASADTYQLAGGAGGNNATMNTTGGAGGTVTSSYGAGGSGGGAGYGGNGGAGGSCDGNNAATSDAHNPSYDGLDAQGYGAGGGGGAAYGRQPFPWGHGGKGGDGFVRIEWTV